MSSALEEGEISERDRHVRESVSPSVARVITELRWRDEVLGMGSDLSSSTDHM